MATTEAPRRRGLRRLLWVVGTLVVLVVLIRVILDPVAAWYTKRTLDRAEGFRAAFSDVHVSVLPPAVEIRRFKMIEEPGGRWDEPLFFVERAQVGVLWRELLRGHLVGRVFLEKPKAVAVRRHEEKAKKGTNVAKQMEAIAPLRVDRIEVEDGEALIAQGKGKKAPQLWVHNIDLVATNLATRKALMEGEPSTLNLTARVQRSGQVKVAGTMDPFTRKPTFTVEAELEKLKVQELHAFLAENAEMRPVSGVINVYAKIKAKQGALSGGVKPIFEHLELQAANDDLGTKLKTFLADTAVEIFTDDIPGRDAVATVIPIKGTIDAPDVQLLPTVLGVVRNAFVVGLQSGFTKLPPATAPKKEGLIKQAVDALKKDEEPQAQPDPGAPQRAEAEAQAKEAKSEKQAPVKRAGRSKPKPRR
jgi:hypothetical protein